MVKTSSHLGLEARGIEGVLVRTTNEPSGQYHRVGKADVEKTQQDFEGLDWTFEQYVDGLIPHCTEKTQGDHTKKVKLPCKICDKLELDDTITLV
jgi:hypothetical protein